MPDDSIPTGVGDTPDNDAPPISPLTPERMHRAEDDAQAAATTPEFNERPDVPTHTAARATREPPARDETAAGATTVSSRGASSEH